MADLLFILIVAGFFALMALLVRACDHIIGPDELAPGVGATDEQSTDVAIEQGVTR
jgi:hypothetical protein